MTGAETFPAISQSPAERAARLSERIHRGINSGRWIIGNSEPLGIGSPLRELSSFELYALSTGFSGGEYAPDSELLPFFRLGAELRAIALGNAEGRR